MELKVFSAFRDYNYSFYGTYLFDILLIKFIDTINHKHAKIALIVITKNTNLPSVPTIAQSMALFCVCL